MEVVLGFLGVLAVLVGAVVTYDNFGQPLMPAGIALVGTGLGFLATAKIITVLMEIRDRLPDQPE